jgi:hypothetical protein
MHWVWNQQRPDGSFFESISVCKPNELVLNVMRTTDMLAGANGGGIDPSTGSQGVLLNPVTEPTGPIHLFISYSHRDERLRAKLATHLSPMRREGLIDEWHDRKIVAGQEWSTEINAHLNTSDIILILISADFFSSDYCYGVEVTRAIERHSAGEATVIPVILRDVDWQSAPFGKLQALPTDGKPVTQFRSHDQGLADVAKGIRQAIRARQSATPRQ